MWALLLCKEPCFRYQAAELILSLIYASIKQTVCTPVLCLYTGEEMNVHENELFKCEKNLIETRRFSKVVGQLIMNNCELRGIIKSISITIFVYIMSLHIKDDARKDQYFGIFGFER